jgi:hypothetical protein
MRAESEYGGVVRLLVKEVVVGDDSITIRHSIPNSNRSSGGPAGPVDPVVPLSSGDGSGTCSLLRPGRDLAAAANIAGSSLSRALRIAEVHLHAGVDRELCVLAHLGSLIPRQRPSKLLGQRSHRTGDRVTHGFGSVTGQRRAVLVARAYLRSSFRLRAISSSGPSGSGASEWPPGR